MEPAGAPDVEHGAAPPRAAAQSDVLAYMKSGRGERREQVEAGGELPALAPLAVTSRVLVDVRPEQQYRKAHAKGSVNVPLFRDIDLAKDGPLGALKAASLLSQGVPATQLNEFVAQFTAAQCGAHSVHEGRGTD